MSSFLGLPRSTQVFVTGVAAAAAVVVFWMIRHPAASRAHPDQVVPLLVIFGLAAVVSELREITTPAGDYKTIVSAIFIASILLLGSTLTLPSVFVGIVVSHLILHRPWFKALFNVSQYILTIWVSGTIYQAIALTLGGGPVPDFNSLAGVCALLALAASYFIVNSGLVAAVVSLSERRAYLYVWNLANLEMLLQYAAMVVVGIIIAMLWEAAPWSLVLVAVLMVGVYVSLSLAGSLQETQRDLLLHMDELQRRTAELTLLNEINRALTRATDLTHLWNVIYEQARRVFDTSRFFVALQDEHSDTWKIVFGRLGETPVAGRTITSRQGVLGQVQKRHAPLLFLGEEASGLDDGLACGADDRPQAILAAPLVVENVVRGIIVAESTQPNAYSDEDLRILTEIAGQAAVAIEKARIQREATEMRALHRLNTLKAEFISTVSHELRSPLTPIVGFAELLSATSVDPSAAREMGAEIHRHAQRMQRLVDDLLDISHMEAGHFRLELVEVDLGPLIERAVLDLSRQSDRHQIVHDVPKNLTLVRGDPLRLRQVLDNLLTNAIKYSPGGGRIDVLVRECDSEIAVSVSDHGIGLPPDKIGRLFEKFYRVDNTLAHRVRGSGLGLAIVKHIVDAHGGRVWVESELGRGSTFTFTLPFSAAIQRDAVNPVTDATGTEPTHVQMQPWGEGSADAEAYLARG